MAKHLVIVESPAKAKTLSKYLGKEYQVEASIGHVRDLVKSKLGVDVEKGFAPKYAIIAGKTAIVDALKAAASNKKTILLASDPDREGEAIAWHLSYLLTHGKGKIEAPIKRVLFEEITKAAVLEAIKKPRDINQHMFESQQARRILDRLVGYQVSPVLWQKVRRGLSAGRVQTVALRIVCEREKEIKAFISIEYWSISADLQGTVPPKFSAYLYSYKGEKIGRDYKIIGTSDEAEGIVGDLKGASYLVKSVTKKERKRKPVAPFITSRLQQEASRKLGFQPSRTMKIAQELYEGIDIGDSEGPVGLITYMRTDSTRISPVALEELRSYIGERYGSKYLPDKPHEYKSKASAQEGHEAIRPTSVMRDPASIKGRLTKDQARLYDLIWKRFVASQMVPAVFDQTVVDIEAGQGIFRSTGQIMKFDGFMTLYTEGRDDKPAEITEVKVDTEEIDGLEADNEAQLPPLNVGDRLDLKAITPRQHFTQPPPRFSQATLIAELEDKGIGRPSTYASIMGTILNREYVVLDEGKRLSPTELGMLVTDLLVESFPNEFDIAFTAKMESKLDDVSEARANWEEMMAEFYGPFSKSLENAKVSMRDIKGEEKPTGLKCPTCTVGELVIKWGRRGEFLACKSYPECKFTGDFQRAEDGTFEIVARPQPQVTDVPCPTCGKPTVLRFGRFGEFRGCSDYPKCKFVQSVEGKGNIGVKCPICKEGDVLQRKSRWGKIFFGCSKYKKEGGCTFATNYKPIDRTCPKCSNNYLILKLRKKNSEIVCPKEECDFAESYVEEESTATTTT